VIFSSEQLALVRAGKITAILVAAPRRKRPPQPNTTQTLWRRYRILNDQGEPTGDTRSDMVYDPPTPQMRMLGEPPKPVKVTITAVQTKTPVDKLTDTDAHCCGYQTADALRDSWRTKHPRTPIVHVVRFTIGDVRDLDSFLQYGGLAGGDYTHSPSRALDSDAPIIPADELAKYAKQNGERYAKRRTDKTLSGRDELVKALEKLELSDAPTAGVAAAIRSIRKQVAVLDRKLKAA
jgi:hypothetical protein